MMAEHEKPLWLGETPAIDNLPDALALEHGALTKEENKQLRAELEDVRAELGDVKQRKTRRRSQRVPAQFDKAIKAGLPALLEKRPDGTIIVAIGFEPGIKEGNELDALKRSVADSVYFFCCFGSGPRL